MRSASRAAGVVRGDAVVVAVVVGEAEPVVEGAGGGVAVFDLEVQVVGAARGGLAASAAVSARARPRRRYAGSTSMAVSPAQPRATATRPMARVRPSTRIEPKACHGAEHSTWRAAGGRPGWPR